MRCPRSKRWFCSEECRDAAFGSDAAAAPAHVGIDVAEAQNELERLVNEPLELPPLSEGIFVAPLTDAEASVFLDANTPDAYFNSTHASELVQALAPRYKWPRDAAWLPSGGSWTREQKRALLKALEGAQLQDVVGVLTRTRSTVPYALIVALYKKVPMPEEGRRLEEAYARRLDAIARATRARDEALWEQERERLQPYFLDTLKRVFETQRPSRETLESVLELLARPPEPRESLEEVLKQRPSQEDKRAAYLFRVRYYIADINPTEKTLEEARRLVRQQIAKLAQHEVPRTLTGVADLEKPFLDAISAAIKQFAPTPTMREKARALLAQM